MTEALHVLPYSGGLLEQPGKTVMRIENVLRARTEKEEYERNVEQMKDRVQRPQ